MTAHFRKPPAYEPDDATWPALLHFANEVAMAYRNENQQLREEIADLHRQLEIKDRIIRTFEIHNDLQRAPR
jgi:hypothetical protein